MYLVQGLSRLSPFSLIDVRVFMSIHDGQWPWWPSLSLVAASIAMLVLADIRLNRRDF
jgi:hypothetical protein